MIWPFQGIWKKILRSAYLEGKRAYELSAATQLRKQVSVSDSVVLHSNCTVYNLSGDPSKISIGNHCQLYGNLTVLRKGGNISMGTHCSLGEGSRIVSGHSIAIGNRVMIAHNVNILDNNSHPLDAALRHEDFVNNYSGIKSFPDVQGAPIVVEDDVWIGFNCIILKGVRIGKGAVIGAGSVVVNDVEPWTVNVGNPLRVVKHLEH